MWLFTGHTLCLFPTLIHSLYSKRNGKNIPFLRFLSCLVIYHGPYNHTKFLNKIYMVLWKYSTPSEICICISPFKIYCQISSTRFMYSDPIPHKPCQDATDTLHFVWCKSPQQGMLGGLATRLPHCQKVSNATYTVMSKEHATKGGQSIRDSL